MSNKIVIGLNKMIGDLVREVVVKCGKEYNFDAEDMLSRLNVDDSVSMLSLSSKKKKIVKEKAVKKSVIPMPFNGLLREDCCFALRQNHGLYTQCESKAADDNSDFCKKCGPSPSYGTIQQRLEVGIMEFRDPKGKTPISFLKVLNKLKISREEAELEASKLNIKINEIHFQEEEKVEKKEKGRPKKPRRKIELADDSTDLFAALVAKANEESEEEISDLSSDDKSLMAESIIDSVLDKVSIISENNEKEAAKKQKKEQDLATKEAAKIQKKEQDLATKEAAKIQKKEQDLATKEAAKQALIQKKEEELAAKEAAKQALIQKKEEELAAKEAAKQALIQKKEADKAEKEAAKQALIQKKEADKAEKEAAKQKKEEKVSKSKPESEKVSKSKPESEEVSKPEKKDEEEAEVDKVKRWEFGGVKYLKSTITGIVYNMDQDPIGMWNEKAGKIDFNEAELEEEEDEYDM